MGKNCIDMDFYAKWEAKPALFCLDLKLFTPNLIKPPVI